MLMYIEGREDTYLSLFLSDAWMRAIATISLDGNGV